MAGFKKTEDGGHFFYRNTPFHSSEEMPLGKTGLQVSSMGFGAMQLSLSGRPSEKEAIGVLHHVFSLGVTFIDTADSYCLDETDKHHNESLIRKAISTYATDSPIVVATKGGIMRPEGRWVRNGRPEYLRKTIRESFEALGGSTPIMLWQHHGPDSSVPVSESLRAVKEAVEDGLIMYVGVSNYSVEQIEEAQRVVDVVSVQNQYNPWHRNPERDGVLEYCEKNGLSFLPWGPLGGRNRAKRLADYTEIMRLSEGKGISPQRLILAWLRAKSDIILPIPGASRVKTAEDSIFACEVFLSKEEVQQIDDAVKHMK